MVHSEQFHTLPLLRMHYVYESIHCFLCTLCTYPLCVVREGNPGGFMWMEARCAYMLFLY